MTKTVGNNVLKAIELKNVAVHYNASKSLFKREVYKALKDVSFDVYQGETLGIIGRNGAGKSTLLRLLAGIIKPDKGEVIHHCKSVSLMALAAGFDPNLSGRQNAVISGMLIGHTKREMQFKLEEIKAFSELEDFFEKPVKTYSSGMRARLGFATAMNTHPDVLLIDEVLAVGDASFKQKAEQAITEKISSDITVIIVSHSEAQIKRLCDRVVLIEHGIVTHAGDSKSIMRIYENNTKFSKQRIKFNQFDVLCSDAVLLFEKFERISSQEYKFRCLSFSLKNEKIDSILVEPSNSFMSGPTETPNLGRAHSKHLYAKKARFWDGTAIVGSENTISYVSNGQKKPFIKFVIENLD